METAVGVVIRTKTGQTDHLIIVLAASAVMMMLGWIFAMIFALVFTGTGAMVVMNVMA